MRIKILIVDDEEPMCEILKFNLEKDGYKVDYALSGTEALQLDLSAYSMFILDIMMDNISGFDFAKRLKNNPSTQNTPIIFCSALDGEEDTVMGLNIGGDDYIRKPFAIGEALARVRAVLRRSHISEQLAYNRSQALCEPDITYRTMRVDRNERVCYINAAPIKLTKTEYEILMFFLTHRNRIYTRDEIIRHVWPGDVVITNRTIDTNITRLRKKLCEYGDNIVTRLGFGYGFKETY